MTDQTQPTKSKKVVVKSPQIPVRWGTSAARFYERAEGEEITLHLITGEVLAGILVGVDTYDVFIEREKTVILVTKHAVTWIEPGPQETITRRMEGVSPTPLPKR
jgi:sRNA-binding regulator protein Hfq